MYFIKFNLLTNIMCLGTINPSQLETSRVTTRNRKHGHFNDDEASISPTNIFTQLFIDHYY